MKAFAEFRIPERYAKQFLPADLGKSFLNFTRIVRVPVESDLYIRIGELQKLFMSKYQDFFFLGWEYHRIYSPDELESAELLLLKIKRTFEPAGEECGTIYDHGDICEDCGSGIRQVSDLILDLHSIPKNVSIARTISNEIIMTDEMAKSLSDNYITGYELKPVHGKNPRKKQNASTQQIWRQLFVNSVANVSPITIAGNDPFDLDEKNEYRCINGHTFALNLLSELVIEKNSWDGSDFVRTKQLFGVNRGLLRTFSHIMLSQKVYRLFSEYKFKGFTFEVVKLV